MSARKIMERIKSLLADGVPSPLHKDLIIRGFGKFWWIPQESEVIDFEAGFDYLSRCRVLNIIDKERFEITEYFKTFAPKPTTPSSLDIQVNRQIRNEAENMQHCYLWLYIFENTLRNFVQKAMRNKYGKKWYDKLSQRTKNEIEENRSKWQGGIPPRNPLESSLLSTLHRIIMNKWEDVFKDKFRNMNPSSLRESLNRIEEFRNTIAHSRMLTKDEAKVFYYEVTKVLYSIR